MIRTDNRGVKDLYLVHSLTQPRPTLETYSYPMPGEDSIPKPEMWTYVQPGMTRMAKKAPIEKMEVISASWPRARSAPASVVAVAVADAVVVDAAAEPPAPQLRTTRATGWARPVCSCASQYATVSSAMWSSSS